jgi:hypothetical protein
MSQKPHDYECVYEIETPDGWYVIECVTNHIYGRAVYDVSYGEDGRTSYNGSYNLAHLASFDTLKQAKAFVNRCVEEDEKFNSSRKNTPIPETKKHSAAEKLKLEKEKKRLQEKQEERIREAERIRKDAEEKQNEETRRLQEAAQQASCVPSRKL